MIDHHCERRSWRREAIQNPRRGLWIALRRQAAPRNDKSMILYNGVVTGGSPDIFRSGSMAGFRKGLGGTGYVEGRNVTIECPLTASSIRLPALTADVVRRRVALIATPVARPL
jgi:hypothetical protein